MGNDKGTPQAAQRSPDPGKPLWLDILDVTAKLLGAIFLLAVAYIGNSFQAKVTGVSLQSQREQAESQLRANMFSNLISPIVASKKNGEELKLDREQLLVELLALNFHENFELKPLMQDVDKKLAQSLAHESSSSGSSPAEAQRKSLWSIARRVADRQIGSIQWEWASSKSDRYGESVQNASSKPGCRVYTVTLHEPGPDPNEEGNEPCTSSRQFENDVTAQSPDGLYTLHLVAHNPDWTNQTVDLEISTLRDTSQSREMTEPSVTYKFTLTWFDLPLTDNTLLPDGNRFAVNLQAVDKRDEKPPRSMRIRILWFPKGYFTQRERPLNFEQVRKLIGLDTQ